MLATLAAIAQDAGWQSPVIDWHAIAPELVRSHVGSVDSFQRWNTATGLMSAGVAPFL